MISLKVFTGENPRTLPHLLAENASQLAQDCDFAAGALMGIRTNAPVPTINGVGLKSLYVHDSAARNVYTWNRDVIAVRGSIADDAFERFYWLDAGTLYVSNGSVGSGEPTGTNKYKAGVPYPQAAPTGSTGSAFPVDTTGWVATTFLEHSDGTISNEQPLSLALASSAPSLVQYIAAGFVNYATEGTNLAVRVTTPSNGVSVLRSVTGGFAPTMSTLMKGYGGGIEMKSDGLHVSLWVDTSSNYIEHRAYVYTYVNQFGEEGAPSDPFEIDVPENGVVSMAIPHYANNEGYCPISTIRLYRSSTGSSSTAYLFLCDLANDTTITGVDSVLSSLLGEPLSTARCYPPPAGIENIIALPHGILALSVGNEIYPSEQYLPYAYKPENVITTATSVVGMCAAEGGMYVTTTTTPYFVMGTTPDSLSETKITAIQAGVSKRSICNLGKFVIYASHDGLVTARGVNVDMDYSLQLFTREEWRDLYSNKLSKMRLDAHDGNLVCWFDDGTPGFLIRFDGENPSFVQLTDAITASFVYPLGDALYVLIGSTVYEYKGGAARKAFTWHSKDFVLQTPGVYSACLLRGSGDVTVYAYREGVLIHTEVVDLDATPSCVFWLPDVDMALSWSFKLVGAVDSQVTEFDVANSPEEFKNV